MLVGKTTKNGLPTLFYWQPGIQRRVAWNLMSTRHRLHVQHTPLVWGITRLKKIKGVYCDSKLPRMRHHHLLSWNQASALRWCVAIQRRTPSRDHGAPLFLPVHPLCLQLADRFIDSMETSLLMAQVIPPDGITSVKNLWEVRHRRLPANSTCFPAWALSEPHEYFGGRRCRNVYWAPGDDPEHAEVSYSTYLIKLNPINSR